MNAMTVDQEILMKKLYTFGVSMGKAKTFVLFGSNEGIKLIKDKLKKLDEYYDQLDEQIGDNIDKDVFDLPEWKSISSKFVMSFNEFLRNQVSLDQYNQIISSLNPKFDQGRNDLSL